MLVEDVSANLGWIYSQLVMLFTCRYEASVPESHWVQPVDNLRIFHLILAAVHQLRSQFQNRSYIIWAILHILILFCRCFVHCLSWQNRPGVIQWDNTQEFPQRCGLHWNMLGELNLFCLATVRRGCCKIFLFCCFFVKPQSRYDTHQGQQNLCILLSNCFCLDVTGDKIEIAFRTFISQPQTWEYAKTNWSNTLSKYFLIFLANFFSCRGYVLKFPLSFTSQLKLLRVLRNF